jgi:hypothetical protein
VSECVVYFEYLTLKKVPIRAEAELELRIYKCTCRSSQASVDVNDPIRMLYIPNLKGYYVAFSQASSISFPVSQISM